GWTRGFEFQSSRGLYRRLGDRFVATGKLAVRSVLEFHLRLRYRQGPSYAALVMIAVGLGATLMSLAARRPEPEAIPAAAAATGVVFGALFQHFELPGALFVAAMSLALHRDDGPASARVACAICVNAPSSRAAKQPRKTMCSPARRTCGAIAIQHTPSAISQSARCANERRSSRGPNSKEGRAGAASAISTRPRSAN